MVIQRKITHRKLVEVYQRLLIALRHIAIDGNAREDVLDVVASREQHYGSLHYLK